MYNASISKTPEALTDRLRSCRENRLCLKVWRNKNVLRVDLNAASEVLETTSLLSEFQTVGAVQPKAWSAKWVLVIGLCSKVVSEKQRRREIWYHGRGMLGLINSGRLIFCINYILDWIFGLRLKSKTLVLVLAKHKVIHWPMTCMVAWAASGVLPHGSMLPKHINSWLGNVVQQCRHLLSTTQTTNTYCISH